ncbi:hypothetical protein PC129_g13141 [Phytophthora cactorum]|uniref:Uncharacterized protein n=1 Tax=Phytophthora cactorum TaxID=29920 RepID=A0A329RUG2_9STRA|nr:hypothetical protein Pcac1_g1462 [Phytophthora cactorum]KAG2808595.1 hypothetical protein PC112_g16901 [Phytophthora cactorum]KAG2820331.1 hypothetical protein PC111_g11511 [Phytophthora cactorum]KAG2850994.1 hypothetical protein PC113_g16304 [Phytophthora cactorum]KAG2892058.1 hypothetical protein PC114_g16746 [Phytophthora cactorum]
MGRYRHQPNLSPEKKLAVLLFLNSRAVNGQLPRGVKAAASREFSYHRQTITSIWSLRRRFSPCPCDATPVLYATQISQKRSRQCRYRCGKYSGASLICWFASYDIAALSESKAALAPVCNRQTSADGISQKAPSGFTLRHVREYPARRS